VVEVSLEIGGVTFSVTVLRQSRCGHAALCINAKPPTPRVLAASPPTPVARYLPACWWAQALGQGLLASRSLGQDPARHLPALSHARRSIPPINPCLPCLPCANLVLQMIISVAHIRKSSGPPPSADYYTTISVISAQHTKEKPSSCLVANKRPRQLKGVISAMSEPPPLISL
jgi:hypothetical protein